MQNSSSLIIVLFSEFETKIQNCETYIQTETFIGKFLKDARFDQCWHRCGDEACKVDLPIIVTQSCRSDNRSPNIDKKFHDLYIAIVRDRHFDFSYGINRKKR